MLRHRPTTTVAERMAILERATAGETDAMIAAALGCSIWTIRKWRRQTSITVTLVWHRIASDQPSSR